ncbi:hypothetical protein COO60DRAFT_882173 [Scenedesmus sp. NREL 46B-D3]|nr:hypothetical protein COO60DRAFT_882173 [Scenedesmus sp. NREL 46B-D3]
MTCQQRGCPCAAGCLASASWYADARDACTHGQQAADDDTGTASAPHRQLRTSQAGTYKVHLLGLSGSSSLSRCLGDCCAGCVDCCCFKPSVLCSCLLLRCVWPSLLLLLLLCLLLGPSLLLLLLLHLRRLLPLYGLLSLSLLCLSCSLYCLCSMLSRSKSSVDSDDTINNQRRLLPPLHEKVNARTLNLNNKPWSRYTACACS